jgi:hypothetical protein
MVGREVSVDDRFDGLAIGGLLLGTVVSLAMPPASAWAAVDAPETRALYGMLLTLALLPLVRPRRRAHVEMLLFAVFLVSMPLVYLEAAWRAGMPLWPQLVGLAAYGALTLAGLLRAPWLLAVGIALHGLGWDIPHLHRGVVTDWYAVGCAVIDVSMAGYAASRARSWPGSFLATRAGATPPPTPAR